MSHIVFFCFFQIHKPLFVLKKEVWKIVTRIWACTLFLSALGGVVGLKKVFQILWIFSAFRVTFFYGAPGSTISAKQDPKCAKAIILHMHAGSKPMFCWCANNAPPTLFFFLLIHFGEITRKEHSSISSFMIKLYPVWLGEAPQRVLFRRTYSYSCKFEMYVSSWAPHYNP